MVVVLATLLAVGSYVTCAVWNGASMGRSVSGWVSGNLAGTGGPAGQAFTIGSIRYQWLPAMRSLFLGGTCPFDAYDIGVWDPDGREVIFAPHAGGRFAVGRVVWPQLLALLPGRGTDTEVHMYDVRVEKARGLIGPLASMPANGRVNIVAAFSSRKPSPPTPNNGLVLTVDGATIEDAEYTMEFPGWRAELNRTRIELTSLRYSSFMAEQEVDRPAFTFALASVVAPAGRLVLGGSWDFPLERFHATRFGAGYSEAPERQHIGFEATALARGASAHIAGRLTDAYSDHPGVDATLDFERGARLATMLPGGGLVAGDPVGQARFHGPFSHVVIDGHAANAEFRVAGLTARAVRARFALDANRLSLDDVVADLGGGHVGGAVAIDFAKLDWNAHLSADGVDPALLQPLVPTGADPAIGGQLEGTASAGGSFMVHPETVSVRAINAHLRRRAGARDALPRDVRVHGGLDVSPEQIRLDNFRVEAGGVSATFRGAIAPRKQTIHSELSLSGRGLGPLLARFGAPPVVSGVSARAVVRGALLEPTIDGEARATDVGAGDRRLPVVGAHIHFEHGMLMATRVHADGFGGSVDGDVAVGLFDGPFTRRLKVPSLHADVRADRLRVHTLLDLPNIRGEISGRFVIDGTLAHPTGAATLQLPMLTIYGDPYRNGVLSASLGDAGMDVESISLERVAGGRFSGKGRVGWDGALDVDVRPRDFPLQAIPALRDSPIALGGMLSGLVHLGGALGRWIPGGVIEASAIRVRDFLLGDGRIDLKPEGNVVRVAGVFFSHFKFRVDGWITLAPKVAGDVTVSFDGLPLDELIPEMKKLAEVQSVASGTARVRFDLPTSTADVELKLSKLLITFSGSASDDESEDEAAAEQFENPPGEDIVVRWDGRAIQFVHLRLLDERRVKGVLRRAGELAVAGRLAPEDSNATLRGRIELRFLESIAARLFEHTHGEAIADLRVLGPMAHPRLIGTLDLDRADLTPRGADRPFFVPGGRLSWDGVGVKLSGLRARLDDAEALAEGSLALGPDWAPGAVALDVTGQVSATPLAWLFPDHVGEPQGLFDVALHVRGTFPSPEWTGFIKARPPPNVVAFREKKLSRDVRVRGGSALLRGYDLVVGCPNLPGDGVAPPEGCQRLIAKIDDSSELDLDGLIAFEGSVLAPRMRRLDVHIAGDNLEWGSPGVFSLQLSPDLNLSGDGDQLRLAGTLNLVNGRYYQNFDITSVFIRPRVEETEPPFYTGIPLLENMELDVNAASSGALFIRDNIADLHVTLPSLDISGTLSEPMLDGTVFVEAGGRFTIPLLRGEFISDTGSITFDAEKDFPSKTPRLDIRASTDWLDRYDQIHHINLVVRGTYKEPELDLSSTDGWDKNQVLVAMATGGTPDQLRRAVTDPSRTPGGGTSYSDGLIKYATNQLMRPIEDPLKDAIHFDLVRLELGYDSVLVKLCWVNKPTYRVCGSSDVGYVSSSHYDLRAELKITDYLSIGGAAERIEHGVDTTEDVVNRGKLQLLLRYPIF